MIELIKEVLTAGNKLVDICDSFEVNETERVEIERFRALIADHGVNLFEAQLHLLKSKKKRYNQKYDFANMKVGEFIAGNRRIDGAFNSWERRNKSGFKMRIGKPGILWRIA